MPTYNGNSVSYGSGGTWYVQLDISNTSATTASTVTVYWVAKVVFTQSIYDSNNTASWNIGGATGSANNTNYSSSTGKTFTIGSGNFTKSVSYTQNNSFSIYLTADGMAGGGTGPSTISRTYQLPKRLPSVPSTPATPTVSSIEQNAATVNMTLPANNGATITATRYRFYDAASGGTLMHSKTFTDTATTSYRPTDLTAATTYYVAVEAYNSAGWSSPSTRRSFTTTALSKPSAPATPVISAITDTTATATWTAPAANGSTITGYVVEVFSGFGGTELTTTGLSVNLSNLPPGEPITVRVRANSSAGYGDWSPYADFVTTGGEEEFDGLLVNDSGTWNAYDILVNDGGTWNEYELWANFSGTWERIS